MSRFQLDYIDADHEWHTVDLPDVDESQMVIVVRDTARKTVVWTEGLGVCGVDFVVESEHWPESRGHIINTGHWPDDEESWVVAATYDMESP